MLGSFNGNRAALQRMIREGDGKVPVALFTRAMGKRGGIVDAGQDKADPDFGHPTATRIRVF